MSKKIINIKKNSLPTDQKRDFRSLMSSLTISWAIEANKNRAADDSIRLIVIGLEPTARGMENISHEISLNSAKLNPDDTLRLLKTVVSDLEGKNYKAVYIKP